MNRSGSRKHNGGCYQPHRRVSHWQDVLQREDPFKGGWAWVSEDPNGPMVLNWIHLINHQTECRKEGGGAGSKSWKQWPVITPALSPAHTHTHAHGSSSFPWPEASLDVTVTAPSCLPPEGLARVMMCVPLDKTFPESLENISHKLMQVVRGSFETL